MEAEIMNVARSEREDKAYWRHHTELHGNSGLTKSIYCQQHQVNYHRFVYWSRKLSSDKSQLKLNRLVPVQLKEPALLASSPPILCSLTLGKGLSLQIHDSQALGMILERLR